MSAWIVSKNHIDLLITAALAWELVVQEQADETGRMLWKECQASVAYRYPDDADGEWPGPIGLTLAEIEGYEFEALEGRIDPDVIDIAARSLNYQSCEHPGWGRSGAAGLVGELRTAAERMAERYRARWGEVLLDQLAHGEEGGAWAADSRTILLHAERVRAATRVLA